MFDMIDLNAEIEKAKSTLNAADNVFSRHQLRFCNDEEEDLSNMPLSQRLERARKLASMEVPEEKPKKKLFKLVPVDEEQIAEPARRPRINSLVNENPYTENAQESRGKERSYSKRKKNDRKISF